MASADLTKRGWYWSRTPRSLPDSSSGSTDAAEGRERRVGRLSLVPRHRRARLDVKREVVGGALGPAARHVRVGQRVERRVDLDDVEALGVVAKPRLGSRDAPRVPGLEKPLVGPAARPESHASPAIARTYSRSPVPVEPRTSARRLAARSPRSRLHCRPWMSARSACSTPVPVASPFSTSASSRCLTRTSSISATEPGCRTARVRSRRSGASRGRSPVTSRARASSSSWQPATRRPRPRCPTCSGRCRYRFSASSSRRPTPPSGRLATGASACSPPRRPWRAAATRH